MDDDHRAGGDHAEDDETPAIVHDDIVQRLLDYQRRLREGATGGTRSTSTAAVAIEAPDEIVDLTDAEHEVPSSSGTPAWAHPSAAETHPPGASEEVVVVDATEATAEPSMAEDADVIVLHPGAAPGGPQAAHAERVARAERSLETLAARFVDLRASFQDMALAADERLAEIEGLLKELRAER